MKLVADWKQCWRWISINAMVLAAVTQSVWTSLPEDMKDDIPHHTVAGLTIALLVIGIMGRLVKQEPKKGKKSIRGKK